MEDHFVEAVAIEKHLDGSNEVELTRPVLSGDFVGEVRVAPDEDRPAVRGLGQLLLDET